MKDLQNHILIHLYFIDLVEWEGNNQLRLINSYRLRGHKLIDYGQYK